MADSVGSPRVWPSIITRCPGLASPTSSTPSSVRLVASLVVPIALVAVLTGWWWLYAVLAIDFVLRGACGPALSPLAQCASRWLRPLVPALAKPTAGAPKRFAAILGAVLTTGAFLLAMAGSMSGLGGTQTVVFALGSIMVVFPALEALAGVCVGCLFYNRLMRVGLVAPNACLDCLG